LFFGTPQSIVPQVTSGKLKAYGITGKEKSPKLPTADSLVSALGPKFDIIYWQGLFAPGGTPDAVVNKLNAALQEIVAEPALVKRWDVEGFEAFPKDQLSVASARSFLKSEIARWGQVIRDNDIHVNQ
jgi:tripartite-type tricarboxylate transporter receptor subunit TctC